MSNTEVEAQDQAIESVKNEATTWGPKLFYGVLIAVLVFFWWMVIYPHGVVSTH